MSRAHLGFAAACGLIACRPEPAGPLQRAAAPPPTVNTPAPVAANKTKKITEAEPNERWAEAAPPKSAPRPQTVGGVRQFDDQPVFVGTAVAGPGLAAWAKVGQTVFVVSPDGRRWRHRLSVVMHDGCEAAAPLDTCAFISFDRHADTERFQDEEGSSPWSILDLKPDRVDVQDAALRPTFLASINAPAPEIIFETFRVDYRKALCEDGADEEHRVLMTEVNSVAPDPLAKARALGKRRRLPRRTLSIDAGDDTIHFAYISSVDMPSDRTMLSLERDRIEWMWVAREHKGRFEVLLDERREVRRGFNHDFACQLPVSAPVPFALRREAEGLTVYTSAPARVQRWRLRDDAMTPEATFDVQLREG